MALGKTAALDLQTCCIIEQLAVKLNVFFSISKSAVASNFTEEELQECCTQGFSPTPMKLTCEERVRRVSLVEKNPVCIEVFNKCCLEGVRLLQKKIREDSQKGFGRSKTKLSSHMKYFTQIKASL